MCRRHHVYDQPCLACPLLATCLPFLTPRLHLSPAHSKVPKKVTTCAFTADGRHMLAADKFGDVLTAATQRPEGERHAVHTTHGLHGNISNSGRSLPQRAFTVMKLTGGAFSYPGAPSACSAAAQ